MEWSLIQLLLNVYINVLKEIGTRNHIYILMVVACIFAIRISYLKMRLICVSVDLEHNEKKAIRKQSKENADVHPNNGYKSMEVAPMPVPLQKQLTTIQPTSACAPQTENSKSTTIMTLNRKNGNAVVLIRKA